MQSESPLRPTDVRAPPVAALCDPSWVSVNGVRRELRATPSTPLLEVLRDELQLVGTRLGCGEGECGACHVLLDGRSIASCTLPLQDVLGREVTTVEGLDGTLAEAFMAEQAAQCGYCGSGLLIAATALLRETPAPDETKVRAALDGHLCRCGTHPRVLRAVLRAAPGRAAQAACEGLA